MLNIVVGGIILAAMTMGFLYACLIAHYNFMRMAEFPYEIFGMIVNAMVGLVGFGIYMTYLPVLGEVRLTDIYTIYIECVSNVPKCNADANMLNVYTILSSVRFLCWYGEFVTSFLFILLTSNFSRTMTFLRYLMHFTNTSLSAATFGMAASIQFPRSRVVGGDNIAPVVIQMLLLVWAMMSFWFIAQSRLYRVTCFTFRPLNFHIAHP